MEENQRKSDLLAALKDIDEAKQEILRPVVDEVVFLEGQLAALRKMPFIKTHPTNPEMQKQTEAARQYVKLHAAYLQAIKVICTAMNKSALEDEDSPINRWLQSMSARENGL